MAKQADKKTGSQKSQKAPARGGQAEKTEGTERNISVSSENSVPSVIKKASGLPKKLENIITEIEQLSVLELSDLVKALQEKFGVNAMAPVAATPAGATPVSEEETKKEEKDSYDVILQSAGENKIGVIKVLREIKPDLGLKEAKTLTEEAPKPIFEGAKKEQAEEAKKKLEEAGAKVELK